MLGRYTTGPLRRGRRIAEAPVRCRLAPRHSFARRATGEGSGATADLYSPMRLIDLRCDTVTRPTAAMRARWPPPRSATTSSARTRPSRALEERAAELLGKEAGLFVAHRARWATSSR